MNDERMIPTKGVASVVTVALLVDGKEVPPTIEIDSLVTHCEANRIPSAHLTIRDGNVALEDFETSNEEFFVPGNKIEIKVGHAAQETTIFKGIIVKHGIKSRSQGSSVLNIECRDEAVKMTVGRKSRFFVKKSDSEVMSELIQQYGLKSEVESTSPKHPELVQYHAMDWDFLLSRADANGLLVLVDNGKVIVQAPELGGDSVDLSLLLGGTMFEFEAEMDARYQFDSVTANSWDYSAQQVIQKQGDAPDANSEGNISESKLASAIGLKDFELRHTGKVDRQELKAWADACRVRSSLAKIIGRAQFPGFAKIKPGQRVKLNGVGKRFNGNAFVAGVRQEICLGVWRTEIQFGMPPDRIASRDDFNDLPAAGLLPAPHGLQIGVATAIEGDPNGEYRIQVKLPLIDPDADGIWARWLSPDAGADRGIFFRPEIGDELIVGFLGQDPRDPVVLGMVHSSQKPAPIEHSDDNHEKAIVTRSKMRIHFDDDKKTVTIDTPGGNSAVVSDDSQSITLTDQHGNKITMDSEGITLDGSKITLNAQQEIQIKAGTDLKAESGANTAIKAGAQLKSEGGAGAELSTSAIAMIKGSMVKIN